MLMDAFSLAAYTSIAIWLLIYLPISLYGVQLLHRHRFVQAISKRHVSMTFVVIFFCLCHICIDRVLWVIFLCGICTNFVFQIVSLLTYPIILYGLLFSLVWRFWIIRFDIHFAAASTNNKWRSIINEESVQQNWYILNRSKWGYRSFIALHCILPAYPFCVICSVSVRLILFLDFGHMHCSHSVLRHYLFMAQHTGISRSFLHS